MNKKNLLLFIGNIMMISVLISCGSDKSMKADASGMGDQMGETMEFSYAIKMKSADDGMMDKASNNYYMMEALKRAQEEFEGNVKIVDFDVKEVEDMNEYPDLFKDMDVNPNDKYVIVSGKVMKMDGDEMDGDEMEDMDGESNMEE